MSRKVNRRYTSSQEHYASKGRFIYDLVARSKRRHSKRQYLNIVKSCDTCQQQTRRAYLYPDCWPRVVFSIIDTANIVLHQSVAQNKRISILQKDYGRLPKPPKRVEK